MTVAHPRIPVSTRHAFALAFDLAFRRDALQSLVVPLLLRAPWIVAIAVLPAPDEADPRTAAPVLSSLALIADFLTLLTVSAMLRFRARSVYNTPATVRPAGALACYARGLARLPWLLVTEIVRSVALLAATFALVVPAIVLGFRLSCATEAVVLDEPHLAGAFARSFRLTPKHFGRWLEMIVVSVLLILTVVFAGATLSVAFPKPAASTWVAVLLLLLTAVTPVIQYAWTFFYLRLREDDPAAGRSTAAGGAAGGAGAPA
jgi:hypothetical protein